MCHRGRATLDVDVPPWNVPGGFAKFSLKIQRILRWLKTLGAAPPHNPRPRRLLAQLFIRSVGSSVAFARPNT
jgi:hypothetical protein